MGPRARHPLERAGRRRGRNTPDNWFTIASVAEKTYNDLAVPFGLREVAYRVRAALSNGAASEWSEAAIFSFGTVGSQGGAMALKKSA